MLVLVFRVSQSCNFEKRDGEMNNTMYAPQWASNKRSFINVEPTRLRRRGLILVCRRRAPSRRNRLKTGRGGVVTTYRGGGVVRLRLDTAVVD